jgi:hypothetical protein
MLTDLVVNFKAYLDLQEEDEQEDEDDEATRFPLAPKKGSGSNLN